jgi:hypothetical protein
MNGDRMALIGRTSELDRIRSVIRTSKESALSIVGRRGVGKSALLSEIPRLSDYRTVFLQASPAESDWPFSGLTALLNGIDDPVLGKIADQLLRAATAHMDVPAVSTMLLTGLHQRSAARTVIVVDDADQLDPSTQAVLGFLSRRLAGTDIALFTSWREATPDSPFHGNPVLRLQALDYKDTVRMLESIPAMQTATAAIHAVAAATQGNPRAAVELYTGLLERQSEGKYALPVPLACRGSFDSEYAAAAGSLGPAARQVLNLMSLSCRSDLTTLEKGWQAGPVPTCGSRTSCCGATFSPPCRPLSGLPATAHSRRRPVVRTRSRSGGTKASARRSARPPSASSGSPLT